jgi:hypothetical protein
MNNKNDPNYIAKLEKAIEKKYGNEAIVNPKSLWSEEKERDYQEQIQKLSEKESILQNSKQIEQEEDKDGYLVKNKLFTKNDGVCPLCKFYTKYIQDDLYLTKYKMCYKCYLINEDKIKRNKQSETK